MHESDVRKKIVDEWSKFAHVSAIENTAGTGMPDVNVSYQGDDFWIEIKYREELPKRDRTPILKGTLRPSQIVWITLRLQSQARNIFFFARVGNELFLYHIKNEEDLKRIETMTGDDFYSMSIWYGVVRQYPDWEGALKLMRDYSKNLIGSRK